MLVVKAARVFSGTKKHYIQSQGWVDAGKDAETAAQN